MVLNVEEFGFYHGILFAISTLVIFICVVNLKMNGSTLQLILLMLYGIVILTFSTFRLWVIEDPTRDSSMVHILYLAFVASASSLCVRPYPILRFIGNKTIVSAFMGVIMVQAGLVSTAAVVTLLDPQSPLPTILFTILLGGLFITSLYIWYCQFKIYKMIMDSPLSKNDAKMQRLQYVSAYSILGSMIVYLLQVVFLTTPVLNFLLILVQIIQTLLFAVADFIIMINKEFTYTETKLIVPTSE